MADRETMAIETLHVREALVPGLSARDLEGKSFYELLRERYGIVIAGGAQTIEPTVTSKEESEALGVPLHSPAFLFERVTHSETSEIVEFVHSIYEGDAKARDRSDGRSLTTAAGVTGAGDAAGRRWSKPDRRAPARRQRLTFQACCNWS